jgi:hypothetical protein
VKYYHGTSSIFEIGVCLLPPIYTGNIREDKRNKFLDLVFITPSLISAWKYANKACKKFGGYPIVYQVEPIGDITNIVNNEYIADEAIIVDVI